MVHPSFKDYFSDAAAEYATFRPRYPAALFDFVASLAPERRVAWDCATGSGQAAVPLADRFGRVIATDASAEQLAHATPHPRVEYGVALADDSGIERESVDLVTVAQALHWFDVDAFYAEVRRVLRPSGAIAVWTYGDVHTGDAVLDDRLHHFAHGTLGPWWPPERAHVDAGYRTLPFPFHEVEAPSFVLEHRWTLPELAGYLRSWSATLRWQAAHAADPVAPLEAELRPLWGDPDRPRTVIWPLVVRAGYVEGRQEPGTRN